MGLKDKLLAMKTFSSYADTHQKGITEDLLNKVFTITDFEVCTKDTGETFCAFLIKESPDFYYAGTVLSKDLIKLMSDEDAISELHEKGLPTKYKKVNTKNDKGEPVSYYSPIYYP